jgi:hypothetical protein
MATANKPSRISILQPAKGGLMQCSKGALYLRKANGC